MHLIQLLLPTRLESGESLADAVRQTRLELVEHFGGVTAYLRSPAAGAWTASDGDVEEEPVVMVEVVAEFDRSWWRDYADRLKRRFQQEQMHVRAMAVEMLD